MWNEGVVVVTVSLRYADGCLLRVVKSWHKQLIRRICLGSTSKNNIGKVQ